MGKLFDNLALVLIVGVALAVLIILFPESGYAPNPTGSLETGLLHHRQLDFYPLQASL